MGAHDAIRKEPKPPFPKQKLKKPGLEGDLLEKPIYQAKDYRPSGKLAGKVALVTGGDSGIGRAVAVMYAREEADVVIVALPEEEEDAQKTREEINRTGRKGEVLLLDLSQKENCKQAVKDTLHKMGKLDILVSNAAYQNRKQNIEDITDQEWDHTFKVNIYAYFYLAREAVKHMLPGSVIIATSSVTSLQGSQALLDYSATKGAINSFSRSLAQNLIQKGIRVNVVAPGPVWTPLNPADTGLPPEKVSTFGQGVPYGRPAQPEELAPAYVFLASNADSSYVTGEILTEMGGVTIAA